uniref:Uncharacterized protein n=1 Tax=Physcomitrium patens TaxID=3218 RepID=A0A2K1JJI8_PHYPA|nr:hypothetical protein PHYPA_019083 [Physcomitrium patens]PNR41679.1 hypothetical protein PHYPA_019084 [Physcomitrium patens]
MHVFCVLDQYLLATNVLQSKHQPNLFFSLKSSALNVNFLEWSETSSKGATFLEHKLTKVLSKTLLL